MKKLIQIIVVTGMVLAFSVPSVLALDGKKLFHEKLCENCHGAQGIPNVKNYPILAGQNYKYLLNQTNDIIGGKRGHGITVLMERNPILHALKPAEVEAIVKYLSDLKVGLR